MKLSKNFKLEEFMCKCGCDSTGDVPMQVAFIMKLQKMRDLYNKPMKITSGYRCPEYNAKIGGAENSYHMLGRAADIYCPKSSDRYALIKYALEAGFRGIGIGDNFVHVDDRDTGGRCWLY